MKPNKNMPSTQPHQAFGLGRYVLTAGPALVTVNEMKVDVFKAALELAKIIQEDKSTVEKDLVRAGEALVSIYQDKNFQNSFQNLREQKVNFLKMAIEDLAEGAVVLRGSELCLMFRDGKVMPTTRNHGAELNGILMFSISLNNPEIDIPQEKINAGIYKLTVALAEIV
jgi:hypothetical protein